VTWAESNIVRDFTEETKAELEKEIKQTAAEAKTVFETNFDVIRDLPVIHVLKKGDCLMQIFELCFLVNNIKNVALKRIYDVFRDARGADVKYNIKLGSIAQQLECYRKTLADLAGLIRPGASGECAFASDDFMANLAKIGYGAVDYWIDQLMLKTCDKGKVNVEPNWDMIEQWLALGKGELNSAQLDALAAVYLSLESDEDVGKFLSRAYSRDEQAPPHVACNLAGAVSELRERVEALVTAEALATIWAKETEGRACDDDVKRRVEKMQALQIVFATAKSIAWDQPGYPCPVGIEGFPIRDSLVLLDRSGGALEFKIADWLYYYGSERFLPVYSTGILGANGTGLLATSYMRATGMKNYITAQVGTLSDAEIDVIVGALISKTISATKVPLLGFGLDVLGTYTDHVKSVDEAVDFLEFSKMTEGLGLLGAKVCYSDWNGQIFLHSIQYSTKEGERKANAFLNEFNNEENQGIKITKDELRKIVLNGNPYNADGRDNTDWKELPAGDIALDREQQKVVYKAFAEFVDPDGDFWPH